MKFAKTFGWAGVVLGCVLVVFFIVIAIVYRPKNPLGPTSPEERERLKQEHEHGVSNPSNDLARLGRGTNTFRPGLAGLTEAERDELKQEFETKLSPALQRWAEIYAGHLAFKPDDVSLQNYYSKVQRGQYKGYTFMVDGATLTFEDIKGVARVVYLNTPETKKLMELPKGESPNMSMPVTRDEVTKMIEQDSGKSFRPDEIRMIPTAASSAMQGGVHVMVGGDTSNSASWLFTLTFGPDKTLNYYLRGADVLSQPRPKLAP